MKISVMECANQHVRYLKNIKREGKDDYFFFLGGIGIITSLAVR